MKAEKTNQTEYTLWDSLIKPFRIAFLKSYIKEAIENEDYEQAAKYRDALNKEQENYIPNSEDENIINYKAETK